MSKVTTPNLTPIKLKHPYKTDAGVPIEQINVRMINVREMKNAQRAGGGDENETNYAMIAVACDLVPEDLDKMMAKDYLAVRDRFLELNTNDTKQELATPASSAG